MNKNNVITVIRVTLGLALWYISVLILRMYIDNLYLISMVLPYTIGLGLFMLPCIGMPATSLKAEPTVKPTAFFMLKAFVVQTGLSLPLMMVINIILTLLKVDKGGLSADELLGNPVFYAVLLLIFNPIMEEVLFRKLIMDRLSVLGVKGMIIVSSALFAVPHLFSQGPAQVPFTFAMGLVLAYVTWKTGKLWPAMVLHALSNLYFGFTPVLLNMVHPALTVLFVLFTLGLMVPLTVVILTHKKRA